VLPPKIICFANAKGGVGKTKASVALLDCLVGSHGRNALLIDTDQQASASLFMLEGDFAARKRLEDRRKTIDHYFEALMFGATIPFGHLISSKVRMFAGVPTSTPAFGSLVAASERIDFVEERIISTGHEPPLASGGWLTKYNTIFGKLCPVFKADIIDSCSKTAHEFIIIDTAAGIRLFSVAAMIIADLIIVPTVPDLASLNATARFIAQMHKYETVVGGYLPNMHLLFTKVQPGFRSHDDSISTLLSFGPSPRAHDILEAQFLQRDIIAQIDNSPMPLQTFEHKYDLATGNVKEITREILALLGHG
jgi:cellulose biosynthesis protein BcsQ